MHTFARSDFLDVVVFADPASPKKTAQRQSELKKVKARMAAVAVGLSPLGHIVVLDAWAEKATTIDFINTLYDMWQRYSPSRIGIEEAAQQGLFIEAFDYIARVVKHQRLPIVGIPVPSNQEKEYRIRTCLQPVISEGRLVISEKHVELLSEIRTFPRGALKDLIDSLAYAIKMLPTFKGQGRTTNQKSETEQYLAHLRNSGAHIDVISAAMRELNQSRVAPERQKLAPLAGARGATTTNGNT